jgi:hypothetical protein
MSLPESARRILENASWQQCQRGIEAATAAANALPMAKRYEFITEKRVELERDHFERMREVRQRWQREHDAAEQRFCDQLRREWAEAA